MSEWKEISLGTIAKEITVGHVGPMATEYIENGIPFLRSQNVIPHSLDLNGVKYISTEFHSRLKKSALQPRDVVIVRTGKPGATAVIPESLQNANCSDLVIVRCGEKLDPYFVSYFINSITNSHVDRHLVGAVQQHFNVGAAKQIQIPDISVKQQTAIASVLSSLDDKIDLLQRQNATLEKMAETLFRQWFVEEAKEEWEEVELRKIIDVVIDNRGKTPPTVEYQTEYPLIEVNALNSNSCLVDFSVVRKYVNKENFDSWFRKHLKVNDIIISTVGTIGVFSIHLIDKGCIAQNLVGLRSNKISSYFIYNFFKINVDTLLNLDIGGVQPSIKVPHLLGLAVKLPPIDLVNSYHESVRCFYKKIAINQTQIRTLTALRDTLLPKLMSGEVRVK